MSRKKEISEKPMVINGTYLQLRVQRGRLNVGQERKNHNADGPDKVQAGSESRQPSP
jgi:hypothetical protein